MTIWQNGTGPWTTLGVALTQRLKVNTTEVEFFPSFWLVELYCYSKFGEFPGCLVVRTHTFTAGALVQSLVGELRSRKPCSKAKKKKKARKEKQFKIYTDNNSKNKFPSTHLCGGGAGSRGL